MPIFLSNHRRFKKIEKRNISHNRENNCNNNNNLKTLHIYSYIFFFKAYHAHKIRHHYKDCRQQYKDKRVETKRLIKIKMYKGDRHTCASAAGTVQMQIFMERTRDKIPCQCTCKIIKESQTKKGNIKP